MYMWRAVDSEGEVLDLLVQRRRDKATALKLLRKLLKKQGFVPAVIVTDKLGSYGQRCGPLASRGRHERDFAPRLVENSHQPVRRREKWGLQIARVSSALRLAPRCRLQHLQCSTTPDLPTNASAVSGRGSQRMERRDACRGLSYELDASSARAQRVNVSMPVKAIKVPHPPGPQALLARAGRDEGAPYVSHAGKPSFRQGSQSQISSFEECWLRLRESTTLGG